MARDNWVQEHIGKIEARRDIEAWRYGNIKLLTYSAAAPDAFSLRFDMEALLASPGRQQTLQKDMEEYFNSILINAPGWWLEDFMSACIKGHFAAKKEMARRLEAGCYSTDEDNGGKANGS